MPELTVGDEITVSPSREDYQKAVEALKAKPTALTRASCCLLAQCVMRQLGADSVTIGYDVGHISFDGRREAVTVTPKTENGRRLWNAMIEQFDSDEQKYTPGEVTLKVDDVWNWGEEEADANEEFRKEQE